MNEPDARSLELLAGWERGEVSSDELRRFSAEAASLSSVVTRIRTATSEPIPDADRAWDHLSSQLEPRLRTDRRTASWFTRPLLVAAIVVGMTGAVAFADPQIGHQLGRVWTAMQGATGHSHPDIDAVPHASVAPPRHDADRRSAPRVSSPGPEITTAPTASTGDGSGGNQGGTSPTESPGSSGDGSSTGGGDGNTQGSTTGGDSGGSGQNQGGSDGSGSSSGDTSQSGDSNVSGGGDSNTSGGGQNSD